MVSSLLNVFYERPCARRRGKHMHIPSIDSTYDPALSKTLAAVIDGKTKPLGSLGFLENLAMQLGLIQQTTQPQLRKPALFLFAADHGVVAENISPCPQCVTWQMVENFLVHGAAINVFARQNGFALHIVDAGVNHDFAPRENLIDRKIAYGTRNFAQEAAMTAEQCAAAIEHGRTLVAGLEGNVVGFGEMGIGNTTISAAIMHKITGIPVADCVGAGAGLTADGVLHKQRVIENAVARHAAVTAPLDILATFGGFEIAMMVGAMLAAAERRMVVLIDGFIATSALLVAAKLQPAVLDYCVFSHCSDENGHKRMLDYFGVRPMLHLSLRLGEGTGCTLALPLLQSAVVFICEMATFESARVSANVL